MRLVTKRMLVRSVCDPLRDSWVTVQVQGEKKRTPLIKMAGSKHRLICGGCGFVVHAATKHSERVTMSGELSSPQTSSPRTGRDFLKSKKNEGERFCFPVPL